jgi:hypothetical protein
MDKKYHSYYHNRKTNVIVSLCIVFLLGSALFLSSITSAMTATAGIFSFAKGNYYVYASSDSSDSDDEDEESTVATSESDEDAGTSELEEKSLEVCDNGIDDNNDGLTDGEDSVTCPQEEQDTQQSSLSDDVDTNTEEQQQEAQLDTDSQLREQTSEVEDQLFEDEQVKEVAEEICDDGLDNDGDNLVDIADDECAGPQTQAAATTAPAPASMTYEEWHNQCIGLAGFGGCPLSPPCNLPPPTNMIETLNYDDNCPEEYQRLQQPQQPQNTGVPAPNEICDNGIDDNNDGLTDGQDPITCPDDDIEICDNGIDDNNDGLTDGEDLARCPDDENEEPEAVAILSGNEILNVGDSATLDGLQSSDPDGDELTYSWSQTAGPSASISSPTSVSPQFTAPSLDSETLLTFQLVVSDGKVESEPSTVAVTVCPSNSFVDIATGECTEEQANRENQEPIANAGPNQQPVAGKLVQLDGSGSSDPDGDELTYEWKQIGGPTVSLGGSTGANPTFTAPEVKAGTAATTSTSTTTTPQTTILTFQLVVNDGELDSKPDTVEIWVYQNQKPNAVARAVYNHDIHTAPIVKAGDIVTLDGSSSSDPDGNELTYEWNQRPALTEPISVSLSDPTADNPTFTAPSVKDPTRLTFELIVDDGKAKSNPATVDVRICPDIVVPSLKAETINRPELDPNVAGGYGCNYAKIDVRASSLGSTGSLIASSGSSGSNSGSSVSAHLFIVYTNAEDGTESVFRAGPSILPFVGGGDIKVDTGPYEDKSAAWIDRKTGKPADAPDWDLYAESVTALKGKAAVGKVECLDDVSEAIRTTQIDYELLGPNSNTYVWTLLDLCGIPVTKPAGTFPGWKNNAIKDVLENNPELQAKLKAIKPVKETAE